MPTRNDAAAGRFETDLRQGLGADDSVSVQILTLYLPGRDRDGREVRNQRDWVLEAAALLARIGGGVTIMPPVEGGWHDREADRIIWERPVLVYTYIQPGAFLERLEALREFLHRLGRETHQGEVVCEFDGVFYRIRDFDRPEEP